ncbi:transposase [Sphingobacterium psychroaquaticum]|uniref:REP element-mobilizing transposase RayT n=1 Tax=Sphingobacterium psychroaquaticum TaxID=561061 RepID=A0A1X7ILI5_9SPHI|nr:transposase [Sphingobacterium psychroaquaticum]QBQ41418.1 transposase [Sphingobacterium psychroaquaticum]SMG15413.1 REP element-mobilizing transposase RayT [Sphingobacterium psychroaquaticum]
MKNQLNRRSIRLQGYDYSQPGMYFITLCTDRKRCLFGFIQSNAVQLNEFGQKVKSILLSLSKRFPHVTLDEFVIMPNHIHAIIVISKPEYQYKDISTVPPSVESTPGLSQIIGSFKSLVYRQYTLERNKFAEQQQIKQHKIWQRNYFEHIVRDGSDYDRIVNYIRDNPMNWKDDKLYTSATS